jgi:hypothetical protein
MTAKINDRFVRTAATAAAILGLVLGLSACATAAVAPATRLALQSEHFLIYTDRLSDEQLKPVLAALEKNYARVTADMEAAGLGPVKMTVWLNPVKFNEMMRIDLGRVYPDAAGYIGNSGGVELLFSPQVARNAMRNFARVVLLKVNPSIGNNPCWLWEAASQYEAGLFTHPAVLEYLQAGHFPSLAELDRPSAPKMRDLGFVLGQYIVSRWGKPGLVGLVRSNGDIPKTLGLTTADFEKEWREWVERTYMHIRLDAPDNRLFS